MKWLHISDLHIIDKANWNVFKNDLIKLCKQRGPIDLVIVTGDFHNFNEKDDFSKAKEFLSQLLETLNLDIEEDLFLVPGNHDGSGTMCEHKEGNIAVLKKDPTRINSMEWNELQGQFHAYEQFVKALIPGYPFEHPAQVHCRIWNNRIALLHCNSAIVSDAEEKTNQLLDVDKLTKIAQSNKLPAIVLVHNHIEDLHEQQQKQMMGIIRTSTIKAYFCGDRHKQQTQMISTMPRQNSQIPCIGSYKSAPEAKDTYSSFGAIIGTWVDEKAELEGWTWSVDKQFQSAGEITGQTIDMGEKYELERVTSQNVEEINNDQSMKKCDLDKYSLKDFRKLIFNMSDLQREKLNEKFSKKLRRLEEAETMESINQYWNEMYKRDCVNEVMEYAKKIYSGV